MTSIDMFPSYSNHGFSGCGRRDAKFSSKSGINSIFKRRVSHFRNLFISKFRFPLVFPTKSFKYSGGMNEILTESYIFQIFKSVISSVSVFVVNILIFRARANKSRHYKSMGRNWFFEAIKIQEITDISKLRDYRFYKIAIVVVIMFRRYCSSTSSNIANFVKSMCQIRRFPNFIVDHMGSVPDAI